MTMNIPIDQLVPGGVKKTDYVHQVTNDRTCSRCRRPIDEYDVPLMLWIADGEDMLIYCDACLGREP